MPFFGSHLWCNYCKYNFNRLRAAYNDSYKILHPIPRCVNARNHQVQSNINTFVALIWMHIFLFHLNRRMNSQNKMLAQHHHSTTAEYCAPIWCRSAHTRLIYSVLNDALHIVTGCLGRTETDIFRHPASWASPTRSDTFFDNDGPWFRTIC